MLELITRHKIVISIGVVVIAVGAWWGLSGSSSSEPLLTTDAPAISDDQEIVATLLQLRSVTLSSTIFSDPVFMSLKDFGQEIKNEPAGRPNPFAPFTAVVTPSASSTKQAQIFAPPTKKNF